MSWRPKNHKNATYIVESVILEAISANFADRERPDPFIYRVWGLCANRFSETRRSTAGPYSLNFKSAFYKSTVKLWLWAPRLERYDFWGPFGSLLGGKKKHNVRAKVLKTIVLLWFRDMRFWKQWIWFCSWAPCFRKPIGAEAPNLINKGIWALALWKIGWDGLQNHRFHDIRSIWMNFVPPRSLFSLYT